MDNRRHARFVFFHPVAVSWTSPNGEECRVATNGIDLCTYGIGVDSTVAIPRNTVVSVEVNAHAFKGEAKVVRCQAVGARFRLGLRFDTALPFFLDVKRAAEAAQKKSSPQGKPAAKQAKPSGLGRMFSMLGSR